MVAMHVVIMGCGRVGSRLARRLERQGHSVAVIDKDPLAFHLLDVDFKGIKVEGIGFDSNVLVQAGIERADVFIAVSSGDNSNFVAARIAKEIFHVPKVVARIYDPRRANIYRRSGIPTVAPVSFEVTKFSDLLFLQQSYARDTFGSGEVELMEFELPLNLAGRTVQEFEMPGEIRICAIERAGTALVPGPGTVLERFDIIHAAVLRSSGEKFKKMFFMA
jgi:trk system potassium uptake protein TrkA